jgi:hypothetical protein
MSSRSSIIKRAISLKAEAKRLYRRFLKLRIVISRRDSVNASNLIHIPVAHLDRKQRYEKRISNIRR